MLAQCASSELLQTCFFFMDFIRNINKILLCVYVLNSRIGNMRCGAVASWGGSYCKLVIAANGQTVTYCDSDCPKLIEKVAFISISGGASWPQSFRVENLLHSICCTTFKCSVKRHCLMDLSKVPRISRLKSEQN